MRGGHRAPAPSGPPPRTKHPRPTPPPPNRTPPAPPAAAAEAFVRQPNVAALATVRPDGRPHVTPVWYDFDGREFTVATFRNTQKLKNLSHKGFATLCIFTHNSPYRNVIVESTARVGSPLDNGWRERVGIR